MTSKGRSNLTFSPMNQARAYFTTQNGISFWGDANAMPSLFHEEIDLIVTSPPYFGHQREYGGFAGSEVGFVDEMVSIIEAWLRMLTNTASIVLNLGDVTEKGEGCLSLYKERLLLALRSRLGLKLVGKFYWISPTKMPTGHWVTKSRRDVVNAAEDCYWFSLNPKEVKANNRNVLVEYSEKQKQYIESSQRKSPARKKRPSGQAANAESFYVDNGGAIPNNLIYAVPEPAQSPYSKYCEEHGLPRHPAMFPAEVPEFFIRYLTERGDVCWDPFAGSAVSGVAAELNDRYWISSELGKEYVEGQIGRMLVNDIQVKRFT